MCAGTDKVKLLIPTEVHAADPRPVRRENSRLSMEMVSSATGNIRPEPSTGMPLIRASASCGGYDAMIFFFSSLL
jgi:hypothetical protein